MSYLTKSSDIILEIFPVTCEYLRLFAPPAKRLENDGAVEYTD